MRRTRILFVDDEELILSSLRRVLASEPYDCFFLTDPTQALALIISESIDIVVADQVMPRLAGVELLALVHQRFPETARILMTGNVDQATAVRAINEGKIRCFIEKPWGNEKLKAILSETDQAAKAERAIRPNAAAAIKTFARKPLSKE